MEILFSTAFSCFLRRIRRVRRGEKSVVVYIKKQLPAGHRILAEKPSMVKEWIGSGNYYFFSWRM
jgi:hypothetical protein